MVSMTTPALTSALSASAPLTSAPPTEAAAFWSAFWPSFWSGSAAGVVTGLITGLVVGFVLLRYQRGIEKRASAEAHGRALSVKLDELRGALTQHDVIYIDSVQAAVPKSAAAAVVSLKDAPLVLWKEMLPKHRGLLDLAIDLQKSHASFKALAGEADELLRQRVRAFNYKRQVHSMNDPIHCRSGIGMLFEVPMEQLLPVLVPDGSSTPEPWLAAWAQISQDTRLTELGPLLRQARADLKTAGERLLVAVNV